jgi:prepilin-type N-terminal cleavage/methylation domain-containing protein
MQLRSDKAALVASSRENGFSLVELLPSIAILSLLMAAILGFLAQIQKKFQGTQVTSEASSGARAALEILSNDIGQAGYNPNFTSNRMCNMPVAANADPQCVTLNDISRINPGDWLSIDTGMNNELIQVVGTTPTGSCAQPNQIQGVFVMNHVSPGSTLPFPVNSYKLPYPTGILLGTGLSNDHKLLFYGDINDNGVINYVEYSLAPTTSPATTVTLKGVSYVLYNLMRSVTPVTFSAGAVKNPPSPLAQNIMYRDISAANPVGPTGQPVFSFPSVYQVGIVPDQVTVVGTVNINLCVAVNPQSIETATVQWFTMSTRIRPINLSSAVNVAQAGGFRFLPPQPAGIPMN